MKETIVVFHEGRAFLVFKEVADQLNLKDRQHITNDKDFWDAIRLNSALGIAKCSIGMAMNGDKS